MPQSYHEESISSTPDMSGGYFLIIPEPVASHPDLCPAAKLFFGRLTQFTQKKGFCWASNAYLGELMGVDERTIKRWLSDLKDIGFIRIETKKHQLKTERKIYTYLSDFKNISTKGQKCPLERDKNVPSEGTKMSPKQNKLLSKDKNKKSNNNKMPAGGLLCSFQIKNENGEPVEHLHKRHERYLSLTPEQQEAYRLFMSLVPMSSDDEYLKPSTVINWLTAINITLQRARELAHIYLVDCEKYKARGSKIDSMGAYLTSAIQKERRGEPDWAKDNRKWWDEVKRSLPSSMYNEYKKHIEFPYVGIDPGFWDRPDRFKEDVKKAVQLTKDKKGYYR